MTSQNPKISKLLPSRPTPITTELEALEYASHIAPEEAVDALIGGNFVVVTDQFSSGLKVLEALKKKLSHLKSKQSFAEQRDSRNQYRTISHRLLLEVSSHKLLVRKAPHIGWLKELYPELTDFALPFPEVQGLNSSWQWYEKGFTVPSLPNRIKPYYGTYFPTRFEHINLFDQFLQKYKGKKEQAIDIGIGSGVLSYLLQKHEFQKIIGTDTNSNALIGIHKKQVAENKSENSAALIENEINLRKGDLFANSNQRFDLIVFNPPWVPITRKTKGIDTAVYYDDQLFPRFFDQATERLREHGQIVLIFSNLAQLMDQRTVHPIEHEISTNNRFKKVNKLKQKVEKQSDKTTRTANWREDEVVELWVLEMK